MQKNKYKRLGNEERESISRGIAQKISIREIARGVCRAAARADHRVDRQSERQRNQDPGPGRAKRAGHHHGRAQRKVHPRGRHPDPGTAQDRPAAAGRKSLGGGAGPGGHRRAARAVRRADPGAAGQVAVWGGHDRPGEGVMPTGWEARRAAHAGRRKRWEHIR